MFVVGSSAPTSDQGCLKKKKHQTTDDFETSLLQSSNGKKHFIHFSKAVKSNKIQKNTYNVTLKKYLSFNVSIFDRNCRHFIFLEPILGEILFAELNCVTLLKFSKICKPLLFKILTFQLSSLLYSGTYL